MNLKGNINSKKTQTNIEALRLCSRAETIILSTDQESLMRAQLNFISHPDNANLNHFLKKAFLEKLNESGISYADPTKLPSDKDLIGFYLPIEHEIPEELKESYRTFKTVSLEINNRDKALQEHENLRSILTAKNTVSNHDLYKLNAFLNQKENSSNFKKFAKKMQETRRGRLLSDYKSSLNKLLESNKMPIEVFSEKLNSTFRTDDVISGFKRLDKKRFSPKAKKIATWVSLAGIIGAGASTLISGATAANKDFNKTTKEPTKIIESNFDYENQYPDYVQEAANSGFETNINTADVTIKPPISNSIEINTYYDAGKDFIQKASEIYKYNTGTEINLSSLGLKNIGYAETDIYTVSFDGETYKFSGMSADASNNVNLENALSSLGAEFTTSTDNIVYITTDGESSIAICDSNGNAVKSGNVMSTDGMYNQKFIATAKKDLENNSIDTEGMPEQELMGYYLLSNNDQNEELSKALGPLVPLARQMENTFRTDKSDPYTVQVYAQMSREIGNDFNSKANNINNKNIQPHNTSLKDDYDER